MAWCQHQLALLLSESLTSLYQKARPSANMVETEISLEVTQDEYTYLKAFISVLITWEVIEEDPKPSYTDGVLRLTGYSKRRLLQGPVLNFYPGGLPRLPQYLAMMKLLYALRQKAIIEYFLVAEDRIEVGRYAVEERG